MVRRWGRVFSRVRPRVSQIARGGLIGATPRGQPWTSAVTLPPGRNGLIAWRMAVLSTFRAPSLGRHVPRELLRSVLLDLPPRIAATACHQRNDVDRYSRYIFKRTFLYTNPVPQCGTNLLTHTPQPFRLLQILKHRAQPLEVLARLLQQMAFGVDHLRFGVFTGVLSHVCGR